MKIFCVLDKTLMQNVCSTRGNLIYLKHSHFKLFFTHITLGMMAPLTSQQWSLMIPSQTLGSLRFPWEHVAAVWA